MIIALRIFGGTVITALLLSVFFNFKESQAKVELIVLDKIEVVPEGFDKNFKSSIIPIEEKKEVVKPTPKKVDKDRKIPTLKDKYKKKTNN